MRADHQFRGKSEMWGGGHHEHTGEVSATALRSLRHTPAAAPSPELHGKGKAVGFQLSLLPGLLNQQSK